GGLTALEWLRGVAALGEEYVMLHSAAGNGASVIGWGICKKVCAIDDQSILGRGPLLDLAREVGSVAFQAPHPLVGWLGYVSYDVGRTIEPVASRAVDDLRWPAVCFTLFQKYLVLQPGGEVACFVQKRADGSLAQVDWPEILRHARMNPCAGAAPAKLLQSQTRQAFEKRVEAVKQFIAAGDIYQANLAQRWDFSCQLPAEEVFARLCEFSAAPYAACLRFEHEGILRHAVSASPELFLAVEHTDGPSRHAITRPIKGTRPRDLTDARRDEALRQELIASAKDHAELTMIVDLLRNDLGRISEYGSVRVVEERGVEMHPTVWHTVATIEARLRKDAGIKEILEALCPGGSITGAPKIRAMQIIEQLEPQRRQLYCGNIGVIGPLGRSMGLSVAIRTILMQQGSAYIYAGGGIVADSVASQEYEETLVKAGAMLKALGAH
ncbi:MAG TPA: anthranilate synthase component I family protein, partial [Phycisphaerae bacterium]